MASKSKALAIDLMNYSLKANRFDRGFKMKVSYEPKLFGKEFVIKCSEGFEYEFRFKTLDELADNVRGIVEMCKVVRLHTSRGDR